VKSYRARIFVPKRYYTMFCHLQFFPNESFPRRISASRELIISSRLLLIYHSRGVSFFPFPHYSLDLSLFSGISRSRGMMNSFETFSYYYKSLRIISFSALGPAIPENQYHSFAQLPRLRKTSSQLWTPVIIAPSTIRWGVVITPNYLAKPS